MPETKVGKITHYYGKINVAVVLATDGELAVGDKIHIKGHTTDLTQVVESLQIEHAQVPKIDKGQDAGMRVADKVHEHDEVFKVTE